MIINKHNKIIIPVIIAVYAIMAMSQLSAEQKPEPKLLWQKNFSETITWPVSMSDDGKLVLVTTSDKLYLLSGKDGEILKVFEGKGRTGPGHGEYPWIISSDGKEIISDRGQIIDTNGTIIKQGGGDWETDEQNKYNKILPLTTPWRYPVYSPTRKYMAFQGAVEAAGDPFIEMYDLQTGKLLWEYKPLEDTLAELYTWGGFKIKFVNDERLVIYEDRKGKLKGATLNSSYFPE